MSKLNLLFQIPNKYDKNTIKGMFSDIQQQVNLLSEGRLSARYEATTTTPNSTAMQYAKGDIVWDSNPTSQGSVAPGIAASYVRLGWVCTAPGTGATAVFQEMRVLTGT